jgi:DNA polymerase III delta subunit
VTVARKGGWHNPPPLIVLSGNEGFLRHREYRKAVAAAQSTGRVIERVDGKDAEAVSDALEPMFGEPSLVVVSNPAKVDLELMQAHQEEGDNTIAVLLVNEGKIRKGSNLAKVSDLVAKRHRIEFLRPTQAHKVEDYVVKFIVTEAKGHGLSISTDLAEALLKKVGSDFGILHFELMKVAAYLAYTEGGDRVTPGALKATMVRTGESSLVPLSKALGLASVKGVLREMTEIKRNSPEAEGSVVLQTCGFLGKSTVKWLHAAALEADGAGVDEAASRVSIHPYVYKSYILPVAKLWGKARLSALLRKITRAEVAVKAGHIAPWTELEAGLVASCRTVRGRG